MSNKIIGSDRFVQNKQLLSPLEYNRQNFYLMSAIGAYASIRKTPGASSNPEDIITILDGKIHRFRLLGKRDMEDDTEEDNNPWHYIEFINPYPAQVSKDYNDEASEIILSDIVVYEKVEVGTRGWLSKKGLDYIAASYNKFINDLKKINNTLNKVDNAYSTHSHNDGVIDRLIRLRQMSHYAGGTFTTEVNYNMGLDTEDIYPNYTNHGPYSDELEPSNNDNDAVTDSENLEFPNEKIYPKFKLFHEYTHFYFENKQTNATIFIDFQHVMIQIDGSLTTVTHTFSATLIPVPTFFYTINTQDVIWSGEISAVGGDKNGKPSEAWENRFVYSKRTEIMDFNSPKSKILKLFDDSVFDFYWQKSSPDKDLISDLIGFRMYLSFLPYKIDKINSVVEELDKEFKVLMEKYMYEHYILNSVNLFFFNKEFSIDREVFCNNTVWENPVYEEEIETPSIDMTDLFYRTRKPFVSSAVGVPEAVREDAIKAAMRFANWLEFYRKRLCL